MLGERHHLGRGSGEPVGQGVHLGGQLLGRDDPVDQADALGLGGVDQVAGQQQLAGLLLADEHGISKVTGAEP